MKMYICVLDEVPDHMVPVLVAHTVLGADQYFQDSDCSGFYLQWKNNHFKKCVVSVNRKEYEKIVEKCEFIYQGYENKTLGGQNSCICVLPYTDREHTPNVLNFAKLWSPK